MFNRIPCWALERQCIFWQSYAGTERQKYVVTLIRQGLASPASGFTNAMIKDVPIPASDRAI